MAGLTKSGKIIEFELEGEMTTDQMIDMLYGEVQDAYAQGEEPALTEENLNQVLREFIDGGTPMDEDLVMSIAYHPHVPRWWVEQVLSDPVAAGVEPEEVDIDTIVRVFAGNDGLSSDLLNRIYQSRPMSFAMLNFSANPATPTEILKEITAFILTCRPPTHFADATAMTAMNLYDNLSMDDQTGKALTAWLEQLAHGEGSSLRRLEQHFANYVMPYPHRRAWLSDQMLSHMLVTTAAK